MKLEQHIYTSYNRREFTTIAKTEGLSQEDILKLKNYSFYLLPATLIYREDKIAPVKYVYYSLDQDRLVVGRAVYGEKDIIGRPGNYLFHNFIIMKNDMAKIQMNPLLLIKYLEVHKLFREGDTGEPVNKIHLDEKGFPEPNFINLRMDPSLVVSLVYFCFNHCTMENPLLIVGSEKEQMDLLGWLYTILPFNLREEISFDTYYYGANLDFKIIGIPNKSEYQKSSSYALKVDAATLQFVRNFEIKEANKSFLFIDKMVSEDRIREINLLYSLEFSIRKGDYSNFTTTFDTLQSDIKDRLYSSNKIIILNHIKLTEDTEMISRLYYKLSVEDLSQFSGSPILVNFIVKRWDENQINSFVNWLYLQPVKQTFYPYIFADISVVRTFLKRLNETNKDILVLFEILNTYNRNYRFGFDEILFDQLQRFMHAIKMDKRLSVAFIQVLESLANPQTESLTMTKMFLKYELGENKELLKEIIKRDFKLLPVKYQNIAFDFLLNRIILTSSLSDLKLQIPILLQKSPEIKTSLVKLIDMTARQHLREDRKIIIKKIILDLANALPQDESIQKIKSEVEMFLPEKRSFLKKFMAKQS